MRNPGAKLNIGFAFWKWKTTEFSGVFTMVILFVRFIFAVLKPPMTDIQTELFWYEVDLIQKRHASFFPADQKQYIQLGKNDSDCELFFLDGYACPDVITHEIEMVFKIIGECALWL